MLKKFLKKYKQSLFVIRSTTKLLQQFLRWIWKSSFFDLAVFLVFANTVLFFGDDVFVIFSTFLGFLLFVFLRYEQSKEEVLYSEIPKNIQIGDLLEIKINSNHKGGEKHIFQFQVTVLFYPNNGTINTMVPDPSIVFDKSIASKEEMGLDIEKENDAGIFSITSIQFDNNKTKLFGLVHGDRYRIVQAIDEVTVEEVSLIKP